GTQWIVTFKDVELKETVVEEEVDILIIQEANITEEISKFFQINISPHMAFLEKEVASGFYCHKKQVDHNIRGS
ncbi:hypothetical protein JTE90_015960, partial [Oedothorax gibbosus]